MMAVFDVGNRNFAWARAAKWLEDVCVHTEVTR